MAFQFVNSFLFKDNCFLIQTFRVEFETRFYLINGLQTPPCGLTCGVCDNVQ